MPASFPAFQRLSMAATGRGAPESAQQPSPAAYPNYRPLSASSDPALAPRAPPSPRASPAPRAAAVGATAPTAAAAAAITKRVNARLQLAAALIEADNDLILQRAAAVEEENAARTAEQQRVEEEESQRRAAGKGVQRRDPTRVGPAPLPQPRLASQSAIFAPYRGEYAGGSAAGGGARGATPRATPRSRRGSDASRLSTDYLGVRLPTERRHGVGVGVGAARSRSSFSSAGSIAATADADAATDTRRGSHAALAAPELDSDDEAEALSEWGVDRFLDESARERVRASASSAAGRRSRANSVGSELAGSRPASRVGEHRDGSAAAAADGDAAAPAPAPALARTRADLELLAKIKLYREQQTEQPWGARAAVAIVGGGGEDGDDDGDDDRRARAASTIVREGSVPQALGAHVRPDDGGDGDGEEAGGAAAGQAALDDLRRRRSAFGMVGESWSDQGGSDAGAAAAGESHDEATPGMAGVGTAASRPPSRAGSVALESAVQRKGDGATTSVAAASAPSAATVREGDAVAPTSTLPIGLASPPLRHPPALVPGGGAPPPALARPASAAPVNAYLMGTTLAAAAAPSRPSARMLEDDLFGGAGLDLGRYPTPAAVLSPQQRHGQLDDAPAAAGVGADTDADADASGAMGAPDATPRPASGFLLDGASAGARRSLPAGGLSTRELQAMTARQTAFPDYWGINITGVGASELLGSGRGGGGAGDDVWGSPADDGGRAEVLEAPRIALDDGRVLDLDDEPERVARAVEKVRPKDPMEAIAAHAASRRTKGLSALLNAAEPDLSSIRWRWRRRAQDAIERQQTLAAASQVSLPASEAGADALGQQEPNQQQPPSLRSRLEARAADASAAYAQEPSASHPGLATAAAAAAADVDDDFVSPPSRGPLRPRGVEAWLPKTLVMPAPLQGTRAAPTRRLTPSTEGGEWGAEEDGAALARAGRRAAAGPPGSALARKSQLYVPEGFVLHDAHRLPPGGAAMLHAKAQARLSMVRGGGGSAAMRPLKVGGASGPRPFFMEPRGDGRLDAIVGEFGSGAASARTLRVPAVAPRGIGRRAAAPSTALFRNQLVQHDEDKEGWGWEAGSVAPGPDDVALAEAEAEAAVQAAAQAKKRPGWAARRAERRARRAKRKRKAARRERRRRRAHAQREGLTYQAVGVAEESPDEDLELSDTTPEASGDDDDDDDDEGEGEGSSLGTDEESWNSDDERRWVDDRKPAGKLYGLSLLDVADEKRAKNKAKKRFYGQEELEEAKAAEASEAASAMRADGDATSFAPSTVATSARLNPTGYNDTRERMQAAFGTDLLWAREMAKRREDEAREAEEREVRRLADEEERKLKEAKRLRKDAKKHERERQRLAKKAAAAAKAKAKRKSTGLIELDAPTSAVHLPVDVEAGEEGGGRPDDDGRSSGDDAAEEAGDEADAAIEALASRPQTPAKPPTLDIDLEGASTRRGANVTTSTSAAEQWFAPSSDEEGGGGAGDSSDETDSEEERERRREAVRRARLSRSLGGLGRKSPLGWELAASADVRRTAQDEGEDGGTSSSDDDVPLSTLRQRTVPNVAAGLRVGGAGSADEDSSSEEEMTLAAIAARRRTRFESMGKLDLDFSAADVAAAEKENTTIRKAVGEEAPKQSPGDDGDDDNDDDDDAPLGVRHANALAAVEALRRDREAKEARRRTLRVQALVGAIGRRHTSGNKSAGAASDEPGTQEGANQGQAGKADEAIQGEDRDADDPNDDEDDDDDDDEDDRPLGVAHPQAAIIAEQAAVIKKLRAEMEQQQQHASRQSMFGMSLPAFAPGTPSVMPPPPPMSFLAMPPGVQTTLGGPRMSMMPTLTHHASMPMLAADRASFATMPGGAPFPPPPGSAVGISGEGGGLASMAPPTSPFLSLSTPPPAQQHLPAMTPPYATADLLHGAGIASPIMAGSPYFPPPSLPPPEVQAKVGSIDRWRSQVAPDAHGDTSSPSGSSAPGATAAATAAALRGR